MASKYPTTQGGLADRLYRQKQEIAQLKAELKSNPTFKKIEKLEADQKDLEAHILNEMKKARLNAMGGKTVNLSISTSKKFSIEDGEEFQEWVIKSKNLQVFPRSLNNKAISELIESGEKIPGIKSFPVTKLSVRKRA